VSWKLVFTRQAQQDAKKVQAAGFREKVEVLLEIVVQDPYSFPPPYERLLGDLKGVISRRINIQHRLIYQVYDDQKTIKVIRMWTHYE
jgi:toxin YoeB